MKILRDEYNGKVPDDFDKLLKLPGVGRKSANLIMGDVFGKPAIVTDTHCIRLCNRIGLVDKMKESEKSRDGIVEELYHQKKETASATDWLTMEEKYVQPEQNLIAIMLSPGHL